MTGPGGAQMVTPQLSGPPQLVQMTPHGIPIMVPTLAPGTKPELGVAGGLAEDRDDTSSQASSETSDRDSALPPAKRVAVDQGGRSMATAARIPPGGFVMTPTRHVVPTSHFTSPGPHVVQIGPNSHIPIVMPTTTATSFVSPQMTSPVETQVSNGVFVKDDCSRRSPLENGICSPHLISSSSPAKRTQVISASHLVHMTPPHHAVPLILPTNTAVAVGHHGNGKHRTSETSNPSEQVDRAPHVTSGSDKTRSGREDGGSQLSASNSTATTLKMPFANIAIQSGTYVCFTLFSRESC